MKYIVTPRCQEDLPWLFEAFRHMYTVTFDEDHVHIYNATSDMEDMIKFIARNCAIVYISDESSSDDNTTTTTDTSSMYMSNSDASEYEIPKTSVKHVPDPGRALDELIDNDLCALPPNTCETVTQTACDIFKFILGTRLSLTCNV